jgi:hypothetical protein
MATCDWHKVRPSCRLHSNISVSQAQVGAHQSAMGACRHAPACTAYPHQSPSRTNLHQCPRLPEALRCQVPWPQLEGFPIQDQSLSPLNRDDAPHAPNPRGPTNARRLARIIPVMSTAFSVKTTLKASLSCLFWVMIRFSAWPVFPRPMEKC